MKDEIKNKGTEKYPFYQIMIDGIEYCATYSKKNADRLLKLLTSKPTANTLSKADVIEVLQNASSTDAICTCDECVEGVAEAILSKLS